LYEYERETSPNIDNFAKNYLVFENTFAPSSWALPNSISLLTSLFFFEYKIETRNIFLKLILNPSIFTLTDILKNNGYKTAAFTSGSDYAQVGGVISRFDEINTYSDNTVLDK